MTRLAFSLLLLSSLHVSGEQLMVYPSEGEPFIIEINADDSVGDLFFQIGHQTPNASFLNIPPNLAKSATLSPRDYLQPVTADEKQDIGFIVNTLGMSSVTKIAKNKSSLKSAGNRVNHVHPLRFLMTIFLDDRMKASMQSLQKRSLMWDEFISGLKKSLYEEAARDNMKVEYVQDFSATLKLSFEQVYPYVQQERWEQLVKALIQLIPRNEDANRYDM
jgi:hypothetical protein